MHMHAIARSLAAIAFGLVAIAAQTDELKIPVGSQAGADSGPLPPHGMLMPRVRAGWGDPSLVHDPVGQPPITRWDYADFSVYFENDHVVHSVVRHRRADAPVSPGQSPDN
jgi:hypothetical protein